jgi:hypothetical protein
MTAPTISLMHNPLVSRPTIRQFNHLTSHGRGSHSGIADVNSVGQAPLLGTWPREMRLGERHKALGHALQLERPDLVPFELYRGTRGYEPRKQRRETLGCRRTSSPVLHIGRRYFARAVGATEELARNFYSMPNHSALAMFADRRDRMDRALEAVEHVSKSSRNKFETLVVVVSTDFALSHMAPPLARDSDRNLP